MRVGRILFFILLAKVIGDVGGDIAGIVGLSSSGTGPHSLDLQLQQFTPLINLFGGQFH